MSLSSFRMALSLSLSCLSLFPPSSLCLRPFPTPPPFHMPLPYLCPPPQFPVSPRTSLCPPPLPLLVGKAQVNWWSYLMDHAKGSTGSFSLVCLLLVLFFFRFFLCFCTFFLSFFRSLLSCLFYLYFCFFFLLSLSSCFLFFLSFSTRSPAPSLLHFLLPLCLTYPAFIFPTLLKSVLPFVSLLLPLIPCFLPFSSSILPLFVNASFVY